MVVYRGKGGEVVSRRGLAYDVVMQLVGSLSHQVYMDASPSLLNDLNSLGIGSVGTLKVGRLGSPLLLSIQHEKMIQSDCGRGYGVWTRDGAILYNMWKDTEVETVASTVHTAVMTVKVMRRVKEEGSGRCVKKEFVIPDAVLEYNRKMGNNLSRHQLIEAKSEKYSKTLFYNCINIAVHNAYVLFCENSYQMVCTTKKSYRQFVENLTLDLMHHGGTTSLFSPIGQLKGRPVNSYVRAKHHVIYFEMSKYCVLCSGLKRGNTKKTNLQCSVCSVPLCLSKERNCFAEWHTPAMDAVRKDLGFN